jgi:hypothetical protein
MESEFWALRQILVGPYFGWWWNGGFWDWWGRKDGWSWKEGRIPTNEERKYWVKLGVGITGIEKETISEINESRTEGVYSELGLP